jgi:hypothetical protein
MPPKLCSHALEMMDDDENKSLEWLFNRGQEYLSSFRDGASSAEGEAAMTTRVLSDSALVEDIDEKDSLLSDTSSSEQDSRQVDKTSNDKSLLVTAQRVKGVQIGELKMGSIVGWAAEKVRGGSDSLSSVLKFPGEC